jgi:hypothetical protein
MTRKPPSPAPRIRLDGTEAELIFRPFTGEEPFPSDKVAVSHLLAQLDALASSLHQLLADPSAPASFTDSVSESLRCVDEMREACEESLAALADNNDPRRDG